MNATVEVRRQGALTRIALNRPEQHNAFNNDMMAALTAAFQEIGNDPHTRVIVLAGNGPSFCAGADVTMMRAAADHTFDQNMAEARAIFDLLLAVDACPKPVVGRVDGAAIGGGAGLVSCCDIVVASNQAKFGFSETRLGIIPAVVSPFVVRKIGAGRARELFLTGERFDAAYAQAIGLVHHVVGREALDAKVAERVEQLMAAGPQAQAAAKALIREVAGHPSAELGDPVARLMAERRASEEGREGLTSFLEKRRPSWSAK